MCALPLWEDLFVWVSSRALVPDGCVTMEETVEGRGGGERGMERCVIPITPRSCQLWECSHSSSSRTTAYICLSAVLCLKNLLKNMTR